jgi:hypothetical protein
MNERSHELRDEIRKNRDAILALRDEVRLKIHLAGMDAKDAWTELQPALHDVERAATEATDSTRRALRDLLVRMRALRARLDAPRAHPDSSR